MKLSCLMLIAIAAVACGTSKHLPHSNMNAGSGADTANGGAGTSSAGSGGTKSMNASTTGAGAQSTAGTMATGGAGGTAVAGSGGSAGQTSDSGVAHDAGKDAGVDAAVTNPAGCPATYAELSASASCSVNAACAYPEGYCTCVGRCSGVAPAAGEPPVTEHWSCSRPVDGCPIGIPTAGSECSDEGRTCNYGSCCIQLVTCKSGSWTVGGLMCPP